MSADEKPGDDRLKAGLQQIPREAGLQEDRLKPGLQQGKRAYIKLAVFALLVAAVVVLYLVYGDALQLGRLVAWKRQLDAYRANHPVLVYGAAFLAYVVVTGLSLPVAAPMSLLYAAVLGFWPALVIVSFASTTGATISFLASRYLVRDAVEQKLGKYLAKFNAAWEREGAFYLFTLRLIPYAPFWVVNLVAGLTPIRTRTYWWVSQLGMLPGTCAYLYLGSQLDPEKLGRPQIPWQLLVAFCILGLLPLALKYVVKHVRRGKEPAGPIE
ncbi:MAG: TVP38/TMEM64 family protein [Planctomycetia bacterium]|nr:TVP38/TMEM64 family protein [Planctomycetia bacterium]